MAVPVNDLAERLDVLESAGEITPRARQLTEKVVCRIERELHVRLNEGNAAQLVTHLAMALGRLDRGEPERAIDDLVEDVAVGHPREFEFAQSVMESCAEEIGRPIPLAEVMYLTVHLVVLLDA